MSVLKAIARRSCFESLRGRVFPARERVEKKEERAAAKRGVMHDSDALQSFFLSTPPFHCRLPDVACWMEGTNKGSIAKCCCWYHMTRWNTIYYYVWKKTSSLLSIRLLRIAQQCIDVNTVHLSFLLSHVRVHININKRVFLTSYTIGIHINTVH